MTRQTDRETDRQLDHAAAFAGIRRTHRNASLYAVCIYCSTCSIPYGSILSPPPRHPPCQLCVIVFVLALCNTCNMYLIDTYTHTHCPVMTPHHPPLRRPWAFCHGQVVAWLFANLAIICDCFVYLWLLEINFQVLFSRSISLSEFLHAYVSIFPPRGFWLFLRAHNM